MSFPNSYSNIPSITEQEQNVIVDTTYELFSIINKIDNNFEQFILELNNSISNMEKKYDDGTKKTVYKPVVKIGIS